MYGIVLILVLVITGGIIAVIGDRMGTKIGKKRLSLFGLRPRHTSTIVTIVTGVVITTLTFFILAAASENVRTALFGMEKLNRSMQQTEEKLKSASEDLTAARAEQSRADAALAELKDSVRSMEEEAERLAAGNRALAEQKDALARDNAALDGMNRSLTAENTALDAANETLLASNAQLADDKATLEKRTQELRRGIELIREGDIVYRAGEVIAAGVIKGNRPENEVRVDINALAQLASRNVSAHLGKDLPDGEIWVYAPEVDDAVGRIAKASHDMVVRIVAASNLVRGEAVRAALDLHPNSIVYRKGEFIIAQSYILKNRGGKQASEEIVMDFLKRVNAAASAHGILPDPIRGTVGVIDAQQIYDIVEKIEPLSGTIVLSAYAHDDTDALGPLRLDIKIERESQ
ncbi:DUF3084 domain-containing protein [uncultured Selenomonas sp.]|mgnify:CR=1 FL=1|uniref:DUF3084 domain-containing protein n=1 Tax=uncultured Selenomonas sp. TaxID=159275 RepID=UPI0028DC2450|nr:DUF3084 domain-containing protein [uncultured Selenomonas sp.]